MMDGVPSKVNVLFVGNVQSWVSVLFMENVLSCVDFLIVLFMDCVQSWSLAPKIARGLDGYTSDQHKFMSIKSIHRYSSTWCRRENPGHGTKIARGLVWYNY